MRSFVFRLNSVTLAFTIFERRYCKNSLMRQTEYAMIDSPRMLASDIEFCGVGGYSAKALDKFPTSVIIDDHAYPIFVRVVLNAVLHYGLIIGADFIDMIEVNLKQGVISINPICKSTAGDESRPEIFMIDTVCDSNTTDVDIFAIRFRIRC